MSSNNGDQVQSENALVVATSPQVQIFPKIPSTERCNGKIHRQNRYCKKTAGWGTEHSGIGRCKLHGGCSTGPKSGQLRYSDFVPTDLVEKYEEFAVENPQEIISLDSEIALVRAKIAIVETQNQTGIYNKDLMQFTELLRRLVETKQKVEEGVKSKITIEFAGKMIDSIIKIIDELVADRQVKKEIAGRMRRLNEVDLGFSLSKN